MSAPLPPVVILNSFLGAAKEAKMAVVVFAGFVDEDNKARFICKHTLAAGTEQTFLGKFIATNPLAVEAAAKAIASNITADPWDTLDDAMKTQLRGAAEAALTAARAAGTSALVVV